MTAWYYSDTQRNRLGPVAADDLAQLHANGQLAPEILVWREGLPDWKPWHEVMAEVLGSAAPAGPGRATFAVASADAPAHVTGNPYEVAERSSPYAAPRAAVAQHADYRPSGEVVLAGFWKRAAAYVIDAVISGIVGLVVQLIAMGLFFGSLAGFGGEDPSALLTSASGIAGVLAMYLAPLAISVAYYAGFHASSLQATPGKLAIGIKVTGESGQRISLLRAVGRYFASILSALILMIGFIMAAFTERKQALHDMIASTLVVDRWAFTSHPERQRRELGTVAVVVLVIGALLVIGYFALLAFVFAAAFAAA